MSAASAPRLTRAFYARDSVAVARALLGQRLVRLCDGQRLGGRISETEAYGGEDDAASHAFHRTPRSAIMYGPPGHAYVYFIYGMHFCLNVVTDGDGIPGAVLIRGIFPEEGLAAMRRRRGGVAESRLADGPGKLCQALGIGRDENGLDLTTSPALFIAAGEPAPVSEILVTPRVGVRGDASAVARPWRFVWRR